jgi:hypothetical protein
MAWRRFDGWVTSASGGWEHHWNFQDGSSHARARVGGGSMTGKVEMISDKERNVLAVRLYDNRDGHGNILPDDVCWLKADDNGDVSGQCGTDKVEGTVS